VLEVTILFLLQDVPYPPVNGIRWKAYHALRSLASTHECHLLSFGDEDATERARVLEKELPSVRFLNVVTPTRGWRAHVRRAAALGRLLPPSMGPYLDRRFAAALRQALRQNRYDLAFYDIVNLAPYLCTTAGLPSIHSPNDATSRSTTSVADAEENRFRKAYLHLSAWLLRRFERRMYHRFSRIHVVSPVDAQYLKELDSRIAVEVIPIAVSEEFLEARRTTAEGPPRVLFTGSVQISGLRTGLLDFVERGWPGVLARFPEASLTVLSKDVPQETRRRLVAVPGLKLVEWVSDYIGALSATDVMVAPDQSGTGLKNRVLQAMAVGCPVVGSPVALEGFEIQDGVHAIERENSEDMGHEIARLLANEDLRRAIGESARNLARTKYSLSVVGARWRSLVEQVVTEGSYPA
jgi:glycosyltransferase involved in cell wall biosynthesis